MSNQTKVGFDPVEDAIVEIGKGNLVIVTDDEGRENEGDLIMAASKVTPESINQMILHARGLICVPLMSNQLNRLGISSMVQNNRESQRTDFTVSVDAAEGISTGISAYDRSSTIEILANPNASSQDLVQPGHVFPLRARPGGVLERAGHTEAAVDLASLAGLHPSGVICEILNEDGSMARLPELIQFKEKWGFKLISIASLIEYRHKRDQLIKKINESIFQCKAGDFKLHVFKSVLDSRIHYALTLGDISKNSPSLVRVQSANVLTDALGLIEQGNDSRDVDKALGMIAANGSGALLYMESRRLDFTENMLGGNGDKNRAMPVHKMDFRDYGIGAQILVALGVDKIRLLSRDRRKVVGLEGYGLEIIEHILLR
jgi:3,4-dihydroxy 2-butanone 4-phosphate synthase/GTP cyclohydrolase II